MALSLQKENLVLKRKTDGVLGVAEAHKFAGVLAVWVLITLLVGDLGPQEVVEVSLDFLDEWNVIKPGDLHEHKSLEGNNHQVDLDRNPQGTLDVELEPVVLFEEVTEQSALRSLLTTNDAVCNVVATEWEDLDVGDDAATNIQGSHLVVLEEHEGFAADGHWEVKVDLIVGIGDGTEGGRLLSTIIELHVDVPHTNVVGARDVNHLAFLTIAHFDWASVQVAERWGLHQFEVAAHVNDKIATSGEFWDFDFLGLVVRAFVAGSLAFRLHVFSARLGIVGNTGFAV